MKKQKAETLHCDKCKKEIEEAWTFGFSSGASVCKDGEWFCIECFEKLQKKLDKKRGM